MKFNTKRKKSLRGVQSKKKNIYCEKDPAKSFVLSVRFGIGRIALAAINMLFFSLPQNIRGKKTNKITAMGFLLQFIHSFIHSYIQVGGGCCCILAIDASLLSSTREVLWHLTLHWSCYELFSSIKRGLFSRQ